VGYKYDIVQENGTFKGKQYQFKMTNIRGNHVALVDAGRVDGAQVADSNVNIKNNNFKGMNMKNPVLKMIFGWALDAKACDSESLEKEIKELKAQAEDEFEGGAKEKKEMLDSMEAKLEKIKEKEAADAAKDNEPEPKKKAEDNEPDEPKKKAEDNEPDPKKKDAEDRAIIAMDEKKIAERASQMAMDMLRANTEVTALCERVIGKLPEHMLYDSAESKINKTLKIAQEGFDHSSKSMEVKTAILETLANNKKVVRDSNSYAQQFASDNASVITKSTNPLLNMIKGVN
jgi:hypothetical protein